jgi:hypothetical protein
MGNGVMELAEHEGILGDGSHTQWMVEKHMQQIRVIRRPVLMTAPERGDG